MAYKKTDKLIEYNNNYNREKYDRVSLMLPKGQKEDIQNALLPGETVNGFIKTLIDAELKRRAAGSYGISGNGHF